MLSTWKMNNAIHPTHPGFRIREKPTLKKENSLLLESEMQVTVRESNLEYFKMDMRHGHLSPTADLVATSLTVPSSSLIYQKKSGRGVVFIGRAAP